MATIRRLASGLGPEQPNIVSCMESSGINDVIVAGLHSIAGHLQTLKSVMMNAMQLLHVVHHVAGHEFLLAVGSQIFLLHASC